MHICSANRHAVVVVFAVFLFGGLLSVGGAHEVSMSYEQNVQLQDRATRMTIDSFNEAESRRAVRGRGSHRERQSGRSAMGLSQDA